ncbi:hypothetical protein [Leptospira perdikensis]|uniref:Uncharacterized protein n=1 Tax=Leptospira perdikensis TaxID=2484948 RepID=A0A4R9JLM4_9LEPT|nr:hypothetical protein [Leptospira perdikensis]TGL45978.1 hypothetical protein EHQ49_00915 [Leptospira perdikensis]
MNFDELIDSIKAKLYERISNPFLFSFTLLLISINWRFFYKLYLSDSISSIDEFLAKNPFKILEPALYSLAYVIITPLLTLFSEPYSELIKTITLYARNYLRKKYQEQEMSTIEEIENKYINEIQALREKLSLEKADYMNISNSLIKLFKTENSIPDDVDIQFFQCSNDLMIGDVALNLHNQAIRESASSGNPIIGLVIGKAGTNYVYVARKGKIESSLLDLRIIQNISRPGQYYLSRTTFSRLEELPANAIGSFQIIGELNEDGSFCISLSSLSKK